MDLNLTSTLDATLVLDAYSLYKQGKYNECLPKMQSILDSEPENWQARLIVAACYFNLNQNFAAQRAFRFVYDKCADQNLKQKACLALQAVNMKIESEKKLPPEFGACVEKTVPAALRIDSILGFA